LSVLKTKEGRGGDEVTLVQCGRGEEATG
jgi:hypothetical protein